MLTYVKLILTPRTSKVGIMTIVTDQMLMSFSVGNGWNARMPVPAKRPE